MSKKYSTDKHLEGIFGLGIICGIGSVINIAGDFNNNRNMRITGYQNDIEAIENDFGVIGQDWQYITQNKFENICQNQNLKSSMKKSLHK